MFFSEVIGHGNKHYVPYIIKLSIRILLSAALLHLT